MPLLYTFTHPAHDLIMAGQLPHRSRRFCVRSMAPHHRLHLLLVIWKAALCHGQAGARARVRIDDIFLVQSCT